MSARSQTYVELRLSVGGVELWDCSYPPILQLARPIHHTRQSTLTGGGQVWVRASYVATYTLDLEMPVTPILHGPPGVFINT